MPKLLHASVLALIKLYRIIVSPLLPPACRYLPSCSEYAEEALHKYGMVKGAWLTVRRLLRCHPWGSSGYDPVPEPVHHKPSRYCC